MTAFRDIVSGVAYYSAFKTAITTNTTTYSEIFDATKFMYGIGFFADVSGYNDGTFTVTLEHSDDQVTWYDMESNRQLFPDDTCIIDADIAAGGYLPRVGAFSVRRYVRAKIVSTLIAGTGATIHLIFGGVGGFTPMTKELYA